MSRIAACIAIIIVVIKRKRNIQDTSFGGNMNSVESGVRISARWIFGEVGEQEDRGSNLMAL